MAVEVRSQNIPTVVEIIEPHGYDVREIVNDYTAAAYIRGEVQQPIALNGAGGRDQVGLVFTDSGSLAHSAR